MVTDEKEKKKTASEHIKMNFELVRKKVTKLKLLHPRASRDELWDFDSPI
jgi:hypothetical protein